jgi:hypothetical protein
LEIGRARWVATSSTRGVANLGTRRRVRETWRRCDDVGWNPATHPAHRPVAQRIIHYTSILGTMYHGWVLREAWRGPAGAGSRQGKGKCLVLLSIVHVCAVHQTAATCLCTHRRTTRGRAEHWKISTVGVSSTQQSRRSSELKPLKIGGRAHTPLRCYSSKIDQSDGRRGC